MEKSEHGFKPIQTESTGYSHQVNTLVKSKPTKPPESYSIVFELDGLTFAEYNEIWNILKQLKNKHTNDKSKRTTQADVPEWGGGD